MVAVAAELVGGRDGGPNERTLRYRVTGAFGDTDDAQAIEAVKDTAPMTHDGLARQDDDIEIESQGSGLWYVEVPYERQTIEWKLEEGGGGEGNELRGPEFSWDTTGGTHHLEQSPKTERAYNSVNIDFEGAIGVNNGEVAGVDVVIPALQFTERHFLADGMVTFDYVSLIRDLTGTVNDAQFRGFEAGEVLFLGARGSRNDPGEWSVEFTFAVSKNKRHIVIGEMEVALKKGWQYLWIHYQNEVDTTNTATVRPKPVAVYVETVYEETDFATLGISSPVLGVQAQ